LNADHIPEVKGKRKNVRIAGVTLYDKDRARRLFPEAPLFIHVVEHLAHCPKSADATRRDWEGPTMQGKAAGWEKDRRFYRSGSKRSRRRAKTGVVFMT